MACVPLIVIGGAVQCGGFFLALYEAATVRREEVPEQKCLPRQGWAWLQRKADRVLIRLGLRKPKTSTVEPAGSTGFKTDLSAEVLAVRAGLPVNERVDALEREMQDLRAKQHEGHTALERQIEGVSDEERAARDQAERERKERLASSLFWEEAGVWTFIAGLILTTVGAIV